MKRTIHFGGSSVIFCLIGLTLLLGGWIPAWGAPYFSDDMEGVAKWTGDSPWSTTISTYHSASKSWTDSPGTYYANQANLSLTLIDPIDLSAATAPQLVFWHRYQIETGFDFGRVEISTDGGANWGSLASYSGISTWKREQIDLTSYAGQSSVKLRFRLETDKDIVWDGWDIDDVAVSEPPNAVAAFSVTNPQSTSLDLAWTENLDSDFASYRIYRSTTAGVDANSMLVTTITAQQTTAYTDPSLAPSTTYYYKVYVFNTSDLASGSKEASGTTSVAQFNYPFFDDLEGAISGWTAQSPWALTTAHFHSGAHSWTDSPGGAYASNADTSLQMTVDLGTANMPVLTFWHRYTFDTGSADFGYVEVREVGATAWKRLYFAAGTQASWTEERVDLSNYAGKKIDIRFRVVSDASIESDGWYIDDIRIGETQSAGLIYPFSDDMEGAATATNWHSSSWALVADAHSGVKSFTDSPVSDYGEYVSSELVMANSIDLSASVHPQLSFWHKYDTRDCPDNSSSGGCDYYQWDYDYARVYLSTYNGQSGTWNLLKSFKGTQTSWTRETIDLSAWAGLPNLRIKFVITDDKNDSVNYRKPGWWVDDVVMEEAPVEVTLSITSSTMSSVDLSWTQNSDPDFDRYELHRSSSPGVSLGDTLVAAISTQAATTYKDLVAMIQPGAYYYRVWVFDTVGNVSLASNEVQASYVVPQNGFPFSENGEGGTAKWSWGSPWGLSDKNPYEGTYCWTDSPGANYGANVDTSLTTFIDLSGTISPVLTFWHHYSLEEGADFLLLQVSTDNGGTWTTWRTFTGTENDWNQERVDLGPVTGNANVGIRFRLTSNATGHQDGWYMDGLTVAEGQVDAVYPFADDMESGPVPWTWDTLWGLKTLPAIESHTGSVSTVWTDSPEGSYASGQDSWLQLHIDLGAAVMPVLSFWQKYALESNSDYGYVEVREGGSATWKRLYFITGASPWVNERVDLTGYAGKQIDIRFRLVADTNGTQSDGWYLDDIEIDETQSLPLIFPFFDTMDTAATETNWHSSSWDLDTDAHSGNFSFTDSPEGDYGEFVSSELVMANTIDLSGSTHPQLTFWHKYDTRDCADNSSSGGCDYYQWDHDYARVYLSTSRGQPGTWTELASFKGTYTTWAYKQIDLSKWAGLKNVRIKFVMVDDKNDSINYRKPGWWIDDIALEEAPVDVTLSITGSSMSSVSLAWSLNPDTDFKRYEIYRSSSPGVTRANALIASISTQSDQSWADSISAVQPGTFYYRMWVIDIDGNVSLGSNEVQVTYSVPQNKFPFLEDGESGTSKWSWGAPWGLTDSVVFDGSYAWTDSPGANYAANADTSLTTFLDLSGTSHPVLTFYHYYSLETGKDFVLIEVSIDNGQTWTTLRSITGTETTWNLERINLTPYAGNANLGFRFRLVSDGATQQDGWYMDNLKIEEQTVQGAYPYFGNMESGVIPWFYDSPWGLVTLSDVQSYSGQESVVWTDSPGASYAAGADTSLYLNIDLGAANMPVLSFWQKYALESNSDYGYVEVREGGSSAWNRICFITGTSPWVQEKVDLSGYAGKQVDIRFRLTADANGTQSDGWYLDDIRIEEPSLGGLPYPFMDDMEGGATTAANWYTSSWALVPDAKSGSYAFTDSPEGDYGSLVSSALTLSSTIDLQGAVNPQLSFWHKYDTRDCADNSSTGGCDYYQWDHDYCRVYLSTYNGQAGTWTELTKFKGTNMTWTKQVIDLSTWAGLPNIRIKFVMVDDKNDSINYTKPGWWIDDVRVGEDETIPSYIQKVSGDGQEGQTGTVLPNAFVARVYDPDSNPKAGILVNFAIVSGGGGLSAASGTSDSKGEVSTTLTLGSAAGVTSVSATIDGSAESVTFSATGYAAGQPRTLTKVSGDNQVNTTTLALPNPLVVKVTDILGDPVPAVNVAFNVVSGDGVLGAAGPIATNSSGLASNTLTLGSTTGPTVISVGSAGLSSVSFTAHAVMAGGSLGDTDGDGMSDEWELANGLDPLNAADAGDDPDNDTLTNLAEYAYGTNPKEPDTDADGMRDDWEIQYGLDPKDASDASKDSDGDGVSNLNEYLAGTVPVVLKHFKIVGPTSESMDFYGNVTIDGVPAQVGDEVAVLDPDGVVCGQFTVKEEGLYGFMHVYLDEAGTTGVDEGAQKGDGLTFRIWDSSDGVELEATPNVITGANPPVWTFDGDLSCVDLNGAGKQVIPLRKGWNLMSFSIKSCFYVDTVPVEPMLSGIVYQKVSSIADVLASINGLYDVVRGFDGTGAHTFDPALPGFGDLKYMAAGYGYWIKMNTAGNLELKGVKTLPSDVLNLTVGWRLVGYWHPAVKYTGSVPLVDFPPDAATFTQVNSIGDIFWSIQDKYSIIRSYDIDGFHTYDPLIPGSFNDLEYLGPGYGMWMKLKTGAELSY